uniref:Reverse transcriptase domain-containing protein n=2 Tax=Graphocephala atropunctata TaxID=36148 RepID=A0A1B6MVF9_9HEMI
MKEKLLFFYYIIKSTSGNNKEYMQTKYRNLKIEYRKMIIEAKMLKNVEYIERSSNKCKAAWKIIKPLTGLSKQTKCNINPDVFNNYFIESVKEIKKEVLSKNNIAPSIIINKNLTKLPNRFEWKLIEPNDILKVVKSMKRSDSQDVYKMSNNLIKDIIPSLAEPLVVSINKLLQEGTFPDKLKISRVCPIYKKGPLDQPMSYRPVSVIPILSKIIESLVHNQVSIFFEHNNLFNSSQFGFRKGHSTIDAIDNLVREIHKSFEKKTYAQATFCDLSKAFDCINHQDLLSKLQFYGFSDCSLNFFKSYLSNRRQMVFTNNKWSVERLIEWGVPQGSVLGPLLFLIYINDLPFSVISKTFLYADDTTFFNSSSDIGELNTLVKNTLTDAQHWFGSNGFLLNEKKTINVLFSLRPIPDSSLNDISQSAKFLGIHIDNQLTWNTHIDYISTRLSRIIFLLRRLSNFVPETYVRTAYFAYFQSVLRYGLIMWGNCTQVDNILILQKKKH